MSIQYWTSRGIAVLDVNYGGSSGYGRAYRERLKGQWGIVDVDDCVNGARYLVERGEVDGNRLAIRGGSAGGYTTLCALTFRDVLQSRRQPLWNQRFGSAGKRHPQVRVALSRRPDRSLSRTAGSLHGALADSLHRPLDLSDDSLPGLGGQSCSAQSSEKMVEAVRAKKLPVAYLTFEGEQHGFRKAENIKRVLEAELYFYSKVFGFELADAVEPVKIENLEQT